MQIRPLAWCAVALSLPALAGPLDPPMGPPSSTMKTLSEVEPRTAINAQNTPGDSNSVFRITEPGSYYLTDNIPLTPGKKPIEIASPYVSIDLKGFTIEVDAGWIGVDGLDRGTLRNGRILGGFFGVNNAGSDCVIEDLYVAGAENAGIRCRGDSVVRRCTVADSAGGISLFPGDKVDDCRVLGSTNWGVQGADSVIITNTIVDGVSASDTAPGIQMGSNSTVAQCKVRNAGRGIQPQYRALITDCVIEYCDTAGIGNAFSPGAPIAAAESIIKRTKIVMNSAAQANPAGINVSGDRVSVEECTILVPREWGTAVKIEGQGARIIGCQLEGLQCIRIIGAGATVADCSMGNSNITMHLSGGSSVVRGCNIKAFINYGIVLEDCNDTIVEGNVIDGDGYPEASGGTGVAGIRLENCSRTRLLNNAINVDAPPVPGRAGISLVGGSENLLAHNTVRHNSYAIYHESAIRTVIEGNVLRGGINNVWMISGSATIIRNVLMGPGIVGGGWSGAVSVNPATAGPWDNIQQ